MSRVAVSHPRIAVVGGGIAGLTLAMALDPTRYRVTVYEAEPERVTGAALGLWPAARKALTRLGVDLPVAVSARGGALRRLDGSPIALSGHAPSVALVHRPQLMAALEAEVPASVERVDEAVEQPADLDADIVVGADGVRSRVRGLITSGTAARRATPYVALRGMTDEPLDARDPAEFWGPHRMFGQAPVDGGWYWFAAYRSEIGPEPLDAGAVLAEAKYQYAGAADVIRRTLAEAGPGTFATRMWTAPPMCRYARGRYVVIGDAAHAALPNLGRGACDAILDAVTLAHALNRGKALWQWQSQRLPATQAARVAASGIMYAAVSPRLGPVFDRFSRRG